MTSTDYVQVNAVGPEGNTEKTQTRKDSFLWQLVGYTEGKKKKWFSIQKVSISVIRVQDMEWQLPCSLLIFTEHLLCARQGLKVTQLEDLWNGLWFSSMKSLVTAAITAGRRLTKSSDKNLVMLHVNQFERYLKTQCQQEKLKQNSILSFPNE